jgi:hypothetical protein
MTLRNILLTLSIATSMLVACATAPDSTSSHSSPTAATTAPTPTPAAANKVFTLAPQPGSQVGGTIQVARAAEGVTLTATVTGLDPSRIYIVDADPLSCMFFVGGPSQSFAQKLTADATGSGTAVWTVPNGMAANANVQVLTSVGTFATLACVDIH